MLKSAIQTGEVLELAIRMEKTAEEFYSRSAMAAKEPAHRSMFLGLSSMELEHCAALKRIKERLPAHPADQAPLHADPIIAGFLGAWLGDDFYRHDIHELRRIAESGDVSSILQKAVELEKDFLTYYAGVRGILSDKEALEVLDKIEHEELRHMADIGETLINIKQTPAGGGQ